MTRQCESIRGCTAPATWHLADLFGNEPDTYLCDPCMGALGGMAVAQRRGWDVRPISQDSAFDNPTHELNATKKAQRGLRAAIALVAMPDTSDDPLFVGNLADRLEQLNGYLFGDNAQLAAALWTALGIQDRRLAGHLTATDVRDVTDFRTSRPLIRDMIAQAVELERAR